jgi:hypothetical protein
VSRLPQLALHARDAEMRALGHAAATPEVEAWREALLELIAAAEEVLDRLPPAPEPKPDTTNEVAP